MGALELFRIVGSTGSGIGWSTQTVGWECDGCGRIYTVREWANDSALAKQAVESCCPTACEDCGEPFAEARSYCRPCMKKGVAERDRAHFEAAEKVPLSECKAKWVFHESLPNEGYVEIETFVNMLNEGTLAVRPAYVWGTIENRVDVDNFVDFVLEEHHENARDFVNEALVELATKLMGLAVKDVVTYEQDTRLVILVPPAPSAKEEIKPEQP